MDDQAFPAWFGRSVVTDVVGRPLLLAHGTEEEWFVPELRYGMGPHFGDIDAARTRLGHRGIVREDAIFTAYLRIENPLTMDDVHFDEAGSFVQAVVATGAVPRSVAERRTAKCESLFSVTDVENDRIISGVVTILKEYGYDGIAYENKIEGAGTLSWIPFSVDQIRAAP